MRLMAGKHMEVPALCLGLKTDLAVHSRRVVPSLQKHGRSQPPLSRSKASHFIVSRERKWKKKRKTNQRMKGKGKSLSYGGYIVEAK